MDNKPITHYERIISQPVNEFANWLAGFCGMQSESEKRNLLEWLKECGAIKQKGDGWYSHKPSPEFYCAYGKGEES